MLELVLAWGAAVFFGASSVVLWHALRRADDREFALGNGLLTLGTLSAFFYMFAVSARLGAFPIINPWIGASFLGFLLAGFANAAWIAYREKAFLAGAAPVATLFALIAALRPVEAADLTYLADRLSAINPNVPGIGDTVIRSAWFPAHVTLALAAYALFALAATMGLLQLALLRVLKAKRGGRPLQFLPSLPVVEKAGSFAVKAGLASLFVALVLGTVGAQVFLNTHLLGDPKEVAGLTVLVIYTAIELGRKLLVWPSRRTALAHVGAFGVLLLVFLGSRFLGPLAGGF